MSKRISNHTPKHHIIDSIIQIVRKWAEDGPSPSPITLGPIDNPKLLFNLSLTDGVSQEFTDSTQHRLLVGAMAFILYCDHTVPLESICDIYLNLTEEAITSPETNIRMDWAAATLGNRLHVGLCMCLQEPCLCATPKTAETLTF